MTSESPSRVVALVGNSGPASRTQSAAGAVAAHRGSAPLARQAPDDRRGRPGLRCPRPHTEIASRIASRARLLIVATPVYKASDKGLLKAFLDPYGSRGLDGVRMVPLVVSARRTGSLVMRTCCPCSPNWVRTPRAAPWRCSSTTSRTCRPLRTTGSTPRGPGRSLERTRQRHDDDADRVGNAERRCVQSGAPRASPRSPRRTPAGRLSSPRHR
ncbi:NAD(P)H-dependent oxidoreductase [Xylanimonas ulmi]